MFARERWAAGGDLRRALGQIGLVVFFIGGVYMTYSTLQNYDWKPGEDAAAYWRTGQEDPTVWYTPAMGEDRYLYSPVFAQILSPITHLPWTAFFAVWLVAETAAFAWLLRPLGWKWVVPLLFWLAPELVIGNVLGFLGVALVLGARRPAFWSVILLTKPPMGIGLMWFAGRREFGNVVKALAATAVVASISFLWQPSVWFDWLRFLRFMLSGDGGTNIPVLALRVGIAAGLLVYAARTRRSWIVPVALLLSTPVFAGGPSFAILAAVPRMLDSDTRYRSSTATPAHQERRVLNTDRT